VSRSDWKWGLLAIVLIALAAVALAMNQRQARLRERLLASLPDTAGADPSLVRFASREAQPLYARYCATCHGADMQGNRALGAPNLTDRVWLYGSGSVFDIERTVLYGIRSGNSKAHNVTDMPAFGLTGQLSEAEIRSLVQYVLQLSGRPHDTAAADEGRMLYQGKGGCFDCHSSDGSGNVDYGAPDLTANVWNSGGDAQALYNAIYFGQHRIMPAWRGTLSLAQIRALAVYVHARSQPALAAAATPSAYDSRPGAAP